MTLADLDIKILQLINQYSINGSITPLSDGTVEDYTLRTRNLIDDCQKEIAGIYPVVKTAEYSQVAANTGESFVSYALPEDCDKVLSMEVLNFLDFKPAQYKVYDGFFYVSPYLNGTLILTYTKKLVEINSSTLSTATLEIDTAYQPLVAYYVAGHVYLEDNATIGTMLMNEYEQKLSRSKPKPIVQQSTVINSWGW